MVSDERLLELAAAYMEAAGKPYEAARRPDGVEVVWAEFGGQFVRMHGFFAPLPGRSTLTVYVMALEPVDPARRASVAELVVRLNHGLAIGRLDLALDTGELRTFASIPAVDAEPTTQQLHALMVTCLGTLDLLMQPIRWVIDGAMSPSEAAEAMPPIEIRF